MSHLRKQTNKKQHKSKQTNKKGLSWTLGRISSQRGWMVRQALEWAAQGSGGVPIPGGI